MGKNIVIIGAGMMGTALSVPLSDNGHNIKVVGTHLDNDIIAYARENNYHKNMKRKLPEGNVYYEYEQLDMALEGADIAVCGVSSFGIDWFIENVLPRIPENVPIISVTKGLVCESDGTLTAFPDYMIRSGRLKSPICAIGGPCTSYELADRRHSSVAFCGYDTETLKMLKETFETPYYHVTLSTDVVGVECAVAMKNAYALAVSMAVGMTERDEGIGCKQAYNPQAAIFGQAVKEMSRMLALVGGGAENIVYAAGDLYVTVYGGRTRLLGTLLGRGMSFAEAMNELAGVTLESVAITKRTVEAIRKLSERGLANENDYPILMYIGSLIEGKTDKGMPWNEFTRESL